MVFDQYKSMFDNVISDVKAIRCKFTVGKQTSKRLNHVLALSEQLNYAVTFVTPQVFTSSKQVVTKYVVFWSLNTRQCFNILVSYWSF